MKTPLIFDLKRASTVDGPGLRTTVFFKGCNLNCFWCHNPEGKSPEVQAAFFAEKCISCGVCQRFHDSDVERAEQCPAQARRIYGRKYKTKELMRILKADLPYYQATGGGVTFSGGECMLYPEALAKLARECKKCGISVAIDTAGNVPFSNFEKALPYTDLFLYDIKCLDPDLHRRGTGDSNALILENLDRLILSGAKLLIRIPVIPNFNDGDELRRIEQFCRDRALSYELLPYHSTGEGKGAALLSN